MKAFLLSLAVLALAYIVSFQSGVQAQPIPPGFIFPTIQNGSYPLIRTNRNIPPFFTDQKTAFRLNNGYCKAYCQRRDVKTWSRSQWQLYGQLWNEANKRGYWWDIQRMHAEDCNQLVDNICAFHFNKAFMPWHRFYISHIEQVFQMIDHEINPGRSYREGEFCLGYWDWGYQDPFNNNLQDPTYNYIFNNYAMGSLPSGQQNIPDGPYKNLRIPLTGTPFNYTQRAPTPGSNAWNTASVANCVALNDQEANGDASQGLSPCIELGCHGAVHTAVGATMGNLQWSAGDPIFFLHHTMIDYTWWIWQKNPRSFYPTSPQWNDVVPQPYEKWMLNDAKDYSGHFCFNYVPNGGRVGGKSPYQGGGSSGAPGSYGSLGSEYKSAVQNVYSQGRPVVQSPDQLTFLRSHFPNPSDFQIVYASYVKGQQAAQAKYDNLTAYYYNSYDGAGKDSVPANVKVASTPSASLQQSGTANTAGAKKDVVTDFLNAITGTSY